MATTVELELELQVQDANKQIDVLTKKVEELEQQVKDVSKANKETKKSFKGLTLGAKALGASLKAAGIGLIVTLFTKLGDLLLNNQKAVDIVNVAWTALGTVVKDVGNAIINFDETLVSIGETLKNIIIERFKSGLNAIKAFGTALGQLFTGNFEAALNSAKEGVTQLTELPPTLVELGKATADYTSEIIKQSDAYVKLANAAKIAEAQQRGIFEQYDRDAEIQRRIRDDFERTAQERLDANEKLKNILDEQEKVQLRLGQISVDAAQKEIELKGRTTDRVVALIEAQNELKAIEADIAGRRAEQEAQDRALRQEILTARREETQELVDLDVLRVEKKESLIEREALARLAGSQKELQIKKEQADKEALIDQAVADAKINIASQTLGAVTQLLGENTAAGKAAGIAQALINAYAGVNQVWSTPSVLPEPFATAQRVASTATVLASALQSVRQIEQVQLPSFAGGAKGSGGGRGATQAAPQFNLVGQGGVNQLADVLNQEQEPARAFVVGSDVSSQQELDRNIVETASIG